MYFKYRNTLHTPQKMQIIVEMQNIPYFLPVVYDSDDDNNNNHFSDKYNVDNANNIDYDILLKYYSGQYQTSIIMIVERKYRYQ